MLPVSALSRPSHHLLLLSSIFLLCSFPALPSLLLHSHSPSSTSSPHVPNTWVCEISPEPVASWWERVLGRNFREGEGHRSEEHPGLQPYDCLPSPWNLSRCSMAEAMLCQMILTDSTRCADSKEKNIKQIVKFFKWEKKERMPKRKSQIIYKGERMFEKKKKENDSEQSSNQEFNS